MNNEKVQNELNRVFEEQFQLGPFVLQELSQNEHTLCIVIKAEGEKFFAKCFISDYYHEMKRAEKSAMCYLNELQGVNTPSIIDSYENEHFGVLLYEHIHARIPRAEDFNKLATMLMTVHQIQGQGFGWSSNNYIGFLSQSNTKRSDWSEFIVEERMRPQMNLALKAGYFEEQEFPSIQELRFLAKELFAGVEPSLLHGDFWNGNFLIDQQGAPYLIDPSIYFGDSLVDLAMSELFGGFDDSFYLTYFENKKPTSLELTRIHWYQLYYLLVHVNIFGAIYKPQVLAKLNIILEK